jgi:hypothetical protein
LGSSRLAHDLVLVRGQQRHRTRPGRGAPAASRTRAATCRVREPGYNVPATVEAAPHSSGVWSEGSESAESPRPSEPHVAASPGAPIVNSLRSIRDCGPCTDRQSVRSVPRQTMDCMAAGVGRSMLGPPHSPWAFALGVQPTQQEGRPGRSARHDRPRRRGGQPQPDRLCRVRPLLTRAPGTPPRAPRCL